ncbi:gluconate:H+ symporter [Rhizomicrobium electricum]|uniref:Gluconate:H+ symporter n=1 Tax=Rhizomicrobium electricum TaxID=480070 RepID=A0ABN1EME6_9PROT|nr:gluconate:H+ symporter [Rhizomicrobium electricum]NIJ46953.1 GntP family gluconate:H+ symporter [Rhizomicrobium electricum]
MIAADGRIALAAVLGIALSILLIVRGRLHPFVALLCGAFVIGPLGGLSLADTAKAVQKGAGDVLGSIGLIVALGLALGTMLQLSNGASRLARVMIGRADTPRAPWMSLAVALVIGLPLFFETGLVLILPIIASAAAADVRPQRMLQLMLSALAGLSVVHALVPPHPGPLLAVATLNADLGRTILYGVLVAVPTAILSGPLLARLTTRGLVPASPLPVEMASGEGVAVWRALIVVLLPVVLIAAGQVEAVLPPALAPHFAWLAVASNPVLALLIACLAALPLLFGPRMRQPATQDAIWLEAVKPAGGILLAIGAGGALKQVLVSAGLSELLAHAAAVGTLSPIILAWLIAVAIRLATGSATVATITAAGVMPGVVAASGVAPECVVLAIGAGSVFFSHVNDPGFWLVKSYLGTSTSATFRTWSVLETFISVVGLGFVFLLSRFV